MCKKFGFKKPIPARICTIFYAPARCMVFTHFRSINRHNPQPLVYKQGPFYKMRRQTNVPGGAGKNGLFIHKVRAQP